ncbi:MAG: hypothetical protein IKH88_18370 [Prevotella sp.]|nr:hypothetical protein [Prevotella sp.]
MSISIKNIVVAIDGIPSTKFDIQLSGMGKWHMEHFSLRQSLMQSNTLTFSMHTDPEEDSSEILFSVCSYLMGKPVKLSLQTAFVELESAYAHDDGRTEDIDFEGFIVSASGSRFGSVYEVHVEVRSWEALLEDNPTCKSFEQKTLNDIVEDVIDDYPQIKAKVDARFKEVIPYCVQYNETNFQFLQRLARRYGEWLYSDGKVFVFGNLVKKDSVTLKYPGNDVSSYSVDCRMMHTAFNHVASSYNAYDSTSKDGLGEMQRPYNDLADEVFKASQDLFKKPTLQNLHSGGFADNDGRDTLLNISTKTQARGEKAGMLTYSGATYSSKLRVGARLIVEDDIICNYATNAKSPVVHNDEILITDITHFFTDDLTYSNSFTGISAACDYPPYVNSDVYPLAPSCRAKVTDNEDPNQLGRIRVQFAWQAQLDSKMKTPWLRLAQPYAGGGKGFSFIPEIGEEVMVDFEGGNAERPYIKGTLYNGPENVDEAWVADSNSHNQVKAIRTRNGHTIEIHDEGSDGYIRIYDNGKENYILTFSTDNKLIKLESTGNIELYAERDIIMHAGHDIRAVADNDIVISASHDMLRNADNDIQEHAGNDRTANVEHNDSTSVSENQFVKVGDNKDEQVAHKIQVFAENIRVEAEDKLLQYSSTHQQKASDSMAMNAGNRIDIKAGTVKVN